MVEGETEAHEVATPVTTAAASAAAAADTVATASSEEFATTTSNDNNSRDSSEDNNSSSKKKRADRAKKGGGGGSRGCVAAGVSVSKKRNRETGSRLEVERRPWFLPLRLTDPSAFIDLVAFFGLEKTFSSNDNNNSANTHQQQQQHGSEIVTAAFHSDRQTLFVGSAALLALQQHKGLHVHSFGQPLARRMTTTTMEEKEDNNKANPETSKISNPAKEENGDENGGNCGSDDNGEHGTWRPCHESARLLGVCATRRRIWLDASPPSISPLASTPPLSASPSASPSPSSPWVQVLKSRRLSVPQLLELHQQVNK
jgi:hypothetical protein